MVEDVHLIDASLEELIRDIYLLVLGIGFSFIVHDLVVGFDASVATLSTLVYFLALYYFLSYDWMAYVALMDRYSYQVAEHTTLPYQGRFYMDLTHLLVKAALIFLALRPFDRSVLVLAAGLFAAWHATISGWHAFATLENDAYDVRFRSHLQMIAVYVGLAIAMWSLHDMLPAAYANLILVTVLALVVVWYATRRKRTLLHDLC